VPLKRRSTIIVHGSTSQKTILNFMIKINLRFHPVLWIPVSKIGGGDKLRSLPGI
jgi:hypothetical protein